MKKELILLGSILSLFTLASCGEQTKVEYVDRIVEVEKPVEVIKEVEVVKEVPVEVEKIVYVDRPVEVEKVVEKEVKVEVPVEKIVEVEKPVEVVKTVYVEKEVEKPVLDLSLITYNANICQVGNKYQYMAIDNLAYSLGECYPEVRCANAARNANRERVATNLEQGLGNNGNYANACLSCWPRGTQYQEVQLSSSICPSLYLGELSNWRPVKWRYVDYGNCYRSYLLVNAEVVKVIKSMHNKGGQPYYQCIVYYDYVLSI